MNHIKLYKITAIAWGLLGILNLIFAINTGSRISWFASGVMFGGAIIVCMEYPMKKINRKLIDRLFKGLKTAHHDYLKAIEKLIEYSRIIDKLTKKLKGGKKKHGNKK